MTNTQDAAPTLPGRFVQIQHLQAQVELLEADSAGRHNSDSRPGSPRESEVDRHVESLQADNARLQMQVTFCVTA